MAKPKSILFHPSLIALIKSGEKTLTYRLDDDHLDSLSVGDTVQAEDSSSGWVFAQLQISEKRYTTFGELPTDHAGNVTHRSKEEQRAVFEGYYGRPVLNAERVLILGFQVREWLSKRC